MDVVGVMWCMCAVLFEEGLGVQDFPAATERFLKEAVEEVARAKGGQLKSEDDHFDSMKKIVFDKMEPLWRHNNSNKGRVADLFTSAEIHGKVERYAKSVTHSDRRSDQVGY
jgi:hypothetical protein